MATKPLPKSEQPRPSTMLQAMPWPSADLAPWQAERLEKILGQQGGKARKAFEALIKARYRGNRARFRRELAFLLTQPLRPKKKPLTGADREDYQETLTTVARHLRTVHNDLSPVASSQNHHQAMNLEDWNREHRRLEKLRPVRDIAREVVGDPLAFANQCRDLADRLESQAKHLWKIKLSPRDQFWFDILVEVDRRTGAPHYADVATLANAILETDGETARVTGKQLAMLWRRRTAPNPHKR